MRHDFPVPALPILKTLIRKGAIADGGPASAASTPVRFLLVLLDDDDDDFMRVI